jgi:hypothetical protein
MQEKRSGEKQERKQELLNRIMTFYIKYEDKQRKFKRTKKEKSKV